MALTAPRTTNETLKNDMWRACDILRRDNNVGGVVQYTEHLAWLLFLKFLDVEEMRRAAIAEFAGESYEPVLKGDLAWDYWASPEALERWQAGELIQFVRGRLLPGLATLTGSPLARTIAGIFSDDSGDGQNVVRTVPVCASGYNLKDVIEIINRIHFEREDDTFTMTQFYEELLERMGSENRIAGEFHSPRPVIRFMVDVIAPRVGETIYDPAYGSAGFLAQAFLFMEKQILTVEQHEQLQSNTFFGMEKKALSALLGTMNMVLHGVTQPRLLRGNTLEESIKGSVEQRYDVILTNPPFGGTEGAHIQRNFPIGGNATELLFLQHILKKLKQTPNGRAAVIVPEGTLFRAGAFAEVKRDLLDQFHLFAVVSLPPGTFAPYSDVKTAILFFQRPDEVMQRNPVARDETWYHELPLPTGLKKFSKGSRIADRDFAEARERWGAWRDYLDGNCARPLPLAADIRAAWRSARDGTAERPLAPNHSWVETRADLATRGYDLSARNPHQVDDERLPPPSELVATMLEHTKSLHERLERLQARLANGRGEE